MAWTPGTRVGDYEIVGTLGYGGMGEVYRVRHSISDRIEAMKLLRAGPASGLQAQEMMDRFVREIRLLATLQHPNIATLHTAFRHEQELVMVMECVEGEDLGRRLAAGVRLEESLRYTRQVLQALRYAHGRGIVHRDIKPSNIMITPRGEVKLLDFGLALGGMAPGAPDQRLTTTGALVGSMHYIAPEHISGEPHDARSDIYAVGVTLYEMITGRLPIEGTTHVQVIAAHLQHAPAPPDRINPKIPAGLSATVMRALAKNPRARWQTAEAFLAALDEDGLRSTPAGDVSQVRVTQARATGQPDAGSPRPGSALRPESMSEITRQLAEHVGPIAGVLVRRASSSSTNLREMCDALAEEIASPAARQKFLSAVHSHLRSSGQY
ncbi:MAG TPA: serine/threonine-protein kinase [Acidobacteriaceae bacterium]|jgi:serine/threonine-protein kinase